jgi:hypothetical protein
MPDRFWVGSGSQAWNSTTNWSATSGGAGGASVPTAADDVFFDANSNIAINRNVNINVASACRRIDFKAYTGAVTMSNTLTVGATVANVTGSVELGSGMTITGNGTLQTRTNTWFQFISNGKHWPNNLGLNTQYTVANSRLIISGSDLVVNGTLTLHTNTPAAADLFLYSSGTGGPFHLIPCGSFTNACQGSDDIQTLTSGQKIIFKGTGTWSNLETNTQRLFVPVDIDAGPNTLTIGTATHASTLTYLSGTVNCTGTFVVYNGEVLNTSGSTTPTTSTSSSSGINFNNLQFRSSAGVATFLINSPLCVVGTLSTRTLTGTVVGNVGNDIVLNGDIIYLNGNLDTGIRRLDGTSNILIQTPTSGYWNDSAYGVSLSGRGGTGNNIDISCSGDFTLQNVTFGNRITATSTLRYITGNVIATGSNLIFSTTGTNTIISGSGITWGNLILGIPSAFETAGVTFVGDHTFVGNFINTYVDRSPILNGNNLIFSGSISNPAMTTGFVSGNTTFVLTGPGSMSMNPAVTTGTFRNNIVFNNGANTFYVSGSFRYQTGTITYTSGIIDTSTFTSNLILPAAASFNTSGMSWYDITIPATATHTLNSELTVNDALTIEGVNTTFDGDGGFNIQQLSATLPAASRTITLNDTATDYIVRGSLNMLTSPTITYTLTSDDSINRAYFTLNTGSVNGITGEYVNATRIDSSRGQTILVPNAVLNDTINWSLGRTLPRSFILD